MTKTYKVTVWREDSGEILVEAENRDEARDKALDKFYQTDEFDDHKHGNTEIIGVELVKVIK